MKKYNSQQIVNDLFASHPKAERLLKVLNNVDPQGCYYGEDVNPDEYSQYVKRFLEKDTTDFSERFTASEITDRDWSLEDVTSIEKSFREIWDQ